MKYDQVVILHDVIEDTPTSYAELERLFGKAVADGVLALINNILLANN
ncbi:MAG: hypothetical protein JEZ14_08890 [Marinilabiliaceae bacterium]|nr:hypothetical protein [Marinilabiliaceae bacterium]